MPISDYNTAQFIITISFVQMWGALLRGCAARLATLSVARNPWSAARRARDPPPSFRQFFTACLALTELDFSYCKMPPDALK